MNKDAHKLFSAPALIHLISSGITAFLLCVMLGSLIFYRLYGTTPLDTGNDAWIMAGYDESDIIQHYSGWLAFRNSEWAFPLGMAGDMACEEGTCISYTDSIPWIAIACKLFRAYLPDTFQYFGIYALLCYCLQCYAGYELIWHRTGSLSFSLIGAVLFGMAPILMERSLRHTSLGSQWLILFAMLIWVKHRKERKRKVKPYVQYLLLLVLAIGIHPYFLPCVGVFLLLTVADDLKNGSWVGIPSMLFDLAVTLGAGYIIGVVGSGARASRGGYGVYSMNLNAPFNPKSLGGYTWSAVLKEHPQILGNYDGFNYLGAGIWFGILFIVIICFLLLRDFKAVASRIRHNWYVLLVMGLCTVFAVSNVVTYGGKILFSISIPDYLDDLCGIFRSSGRLFYPVYYFVFLGVVSLIWESVKKIGKLRAKVVMLLILLIQVFDLHHCVQEKNYRMTMNREYDSIICDDTLNGILAENEYLLLDQMEEEDSERPIAVAALKNGEKLFFSTAGSGNRFPKTEQKAGEIRQRIIETGEIEGFVIATQSEQSLREYLEHDGVAFYCQDDVYYIFSA